MNLNSYFKEIQQFLLSEEVKEFSSEEIEEKLARLMTLRTRFKTFIKSLKKAKIKFKDVKNAVENLNKKIVKSDNQPPDNEITGETIKGTTGKPDSNGTQGATSGKSDVVNVQQVNTQSLKSIQGTSTKERPSNITNTKVLNTKLSSTPQKISPIKSGRKPVNSKKSSNKSTRRNKRKTSNKSTRRNKRKTR